VIEELGLSITKDSTLFEVLCLFEILRVLSEDHWHLDSLTLMEGSLTLKGRRSNDRLQLWYQRIPGGLSTGSAYTGVQSHHGILDAKELLPDIVIRLDSGGSHRWFVLECKMGTKRSAEASARAALHDLFAYRRAFAAALDSQTGPYGAGFVWGQGLAPAEGEVLLASHDSIDAVINMLLN